MSNAKQQAIAAKLLNTALHHLGELNVPYVLILEGVPQVFSNAEPRHATALLEDAAFYSCTLREKSIEARVF